MPPKRASPPAHRSPTAEAAAAAAPKATTTTTATMAAPAVVAPGEAFEVEVVSGEASPMRVVVERPSGGEARATTTATTTTTTTTQRGATTKRARTDDADAGAGAGVDDDASVESAPLHAHANLDPTARALTAYLMDRNAAAATTTTEPDFSATPRGNGVWSLTISTPGVWAITARRVGSRGGGTDNLASTLVHVGDRRLVHERLDRWGSKFLTLRSPTQTFIEANLDVTSRGQASFSSVGLVHGRVRCELRLEQGDLITSIPTMDWANHALPPHTKVMRDAEFYASLALVPGTPDSPSRVVLRCRVNVNSRDYGNARFVVVVFTDDATVAPTAIGPFGAVTRQNKKEPSAAAGKDVHVVVDSDDPPQPPAGSESWWASLRALREAMAANLARLDGLLAHPPALAPVASGAPPPLSRSMQVLADLAMAAQPVQQRGASVDAAARTSHSYTGAAAGAAGGQGSSSSLGLGGLGDDTSLLALAFSPSNPLYFSGGGQAVSGSLSGLTSNLSHPPAPPPTGVPLLGGLALNAQMMSAAVAPMPPTMAMTTTTTASTASDARTTNPAQVEEDDPNARFAACFLVDDMGAEVSSGNLKDGRPAWLPIFNGHGKVEELVRVFADGSESAAAPAACAAMIPPTAHASLRTRFEDGSPAAFARDFVRLDGAASVDEVLAEAKRRARERVGLS